MQIYSMQPAVEVSFVFLLLLLIHQCASAKNHSDLIKREVLNASGPFGRALEDLSAPTLTFPFQTKIRGLFNTGTNFVDDVMRQNAFDSTSIHFKHATAVGPTDLFGCWKHTPLWLLLYSRTHVYDMSSQLTTALLTVVVVRHPLAWMESMSRHWYNLKCKDNERLTKCAFSGMHHNALHYCAGPDTDKTEFPGLEDLWYEYYRSFRQYSSELQLVKGRERNTVMLRYEDLVLSEVSVIKFLKTKLPSQSIKGGDIQVNPPSAHPKRSSEKKDSGPSNLQEYQEYLKTFGYLAKLPPSVVERVVSKKSTVMELASDFGYPDASFGL
jgi:hypothetical protein